MGLAIFGLFLASSMVAPQSLAQDNSCNFRPLTYIIEKKADGKYYPLRSPDALNWGVIYDKVASTYGAKADNYSAFNRMGEFDPCGEDGCDVTTETWGLDGLDDPSAQYNIKGGDVASVSLTYDRSAYKIIGQCLPNQKCQPLSAGSVPSTISNIPIKCGADHSSGWVVERSGITDEEDDPDPTTDPDITESPDPTTDPEVTGSPNPTKDPTREVVTISGKITIVHPVGATLLDVRVLCQGTCDEDKISPTNKQLTTNKATTTYDYDFEASVGDTYKLKTAVQYRLSGDNEDYEEFGAGRTVSSKRQTENFYVYLLHATRTTKTPTKPPVAPTKKVTTPAPTKKIVSPTGSTKLPSAIDNGIKVQFIVRNATSGTPIKNVSPIICRKDAGWIHYTDVFRNPRKQSSDLCLKLDKVGGLEIVGDTRGALNQTKTRTATITTNYTGFSLKNGDEVKVGCQFDSTGTIFSDTCPLKSAIVGKNGIIQYITLTANRDVDQSEFDTSNHNLGFPLKINIKNASKTTIVDNVYPIICKKDAGFTDYKNFFIRHDAITSSKCLKLDKVAGGIGDTRPEDNEQIVAGPFIIPTNFNGFKIKEGEEIMIGCQFSTGTLLNAHTCPLKPAIGGGDEVVQTITITANDRIVGVSSTSLDCETDEKGNCKASLQL